MKKVLYLLFAGMLILGATACGKEAEQDIQTTETEVEELTTEEKITTEEITEEVTTTEVVTTEDVTTTEAETNTQQTDTDGSNQSLTESERGKMLSTEDAEVYLYRVFGREDEETGNTFSFGYADTLTVDGEQYYMFVWSWLVDDHSSRISDLFVAVDGSAIYEGIYNGETAELFKEKNYLEN